MTRRLEAGFRRRFRDLLTLVRPRRLDFGVELLLGRARERASREGRPLAAALADLGLRLREPRCMAYGGVLQGCVAIAACLMRSATAAF